MAASTNSTSVNSNGSNRKQWSKSDFFAVFAIATIPILVLLIAMLPGHPYGYFIFLRWIVCAAAALMAMLLHANNFVRWAYGFGFVALLYNPILPVHLTRSIWLIINLATIAAFVIGVSALVIHEYRLKRQNK